MQASDNNHAEGQQLAVITEALYVINLLLLPFVAFVILLFIYLRNHKNTSVLAKSHLEQTISASLWIAVMFTTAASIIYSLNRLGMEDVTTWIVVVLLFTILHACMVLLGVIGLAKALSGKCWRYPLFGRELPPGCPE